MKRIEIEGHGKFLVILDAPFEVIELVDTLPSRCGFMIGYPKKETGLLVTATADANPHQRNALRRVSATTGRTFPVLFKSREMADEICFILNKKL